jgi:hypothetical protein
VVLSGYSGGTAEARELAGKEADAWINIARRGGGNYNGSKWPGFSTEKVWTMISNKVCELKMIPTEKRADASTHNWQHKGRGGKGGQCGRMDRIAGNF